MKQIWDFRDGKILLRAILPVWLFALVFTSAADPAEEDCCGGNPALVAAITAEQRTTLPVSRPALSGKVNRTVPEVAQPKAALDFSLKPTVGEFFRSRLFEEPLIPVGGNPMDAENAALAAALRAYAARTSPDDFSSLDGFLTKYPKSPWRAALLTNLGIEYYNTGHYSGTIESWRAAWELAKDATEAKAKGIADRAAGELASMYARLGRMGELEALLKSVEGRIFTGPATERITESREGFWMMENDPGVSFRCGPLALHRIQLALDPKNARTDLVLSAKSTQDGFSLPQVVKLSEEMGLKYRAAFREKGAAFVVPAVIHWKVGHYAALIREEDGRYLVQDPTFRNDLWITRAALDAEASGYFVIPSGELAANWRAVDEAEGGKIWGKGNINGPDPGDGGGGPKPGPCKGMAVSDVDLLFVSLELSDAPLGYEPPVGPPVNFQLTYNQREAAQPSNFTYSNFGPKWTFDWLAYIQDNPLNLNADVQYYRREGFIRIFSGFSAATQSFVLQRNDLTKLTRTSATSYEMVSNDGSKMVFGQSDGSAGTSRRIFLTQIVDTRGNALTLTYDGNMRLVALTDAIGQVTTLAYQDPTDIYRITKVTDPFGRFATFEYDLSNRLEKITDVIGITSQFVYSGATDFIQSLITPYGTTTFIKAESGTTRSLDTIYPDGNRTRVEFNQSTTLGTPNSEPAALVPVGMSTINQYIYYRNTYYWDKLAYAAGAGDYSKAKMYHWVHSTNPTTAARMVESEKDPLENRVWYNYPNQVGGSYFAGSMNVPTQIGRVMDDGTTQLYTYEYNSFGKMTRQVDPVGRTFSYTYAANGQDLLETRMTRNGANELLSSATYNSQHLPLTVTDAAGQTTTYTYNARGQVLTATNAKNEVTTSQYDANGYLTSRDGPLPGPADTTSWTRDVVGRVRTVTDESGYTLTFDYDNLDRTTRITYPDATKDEYVFNRLNQTLIRDRANRETLFEYNAVGQMTKRTNPLGQITHFQWCKCGDLKSLTDPLGRTTTWRHDVQGRVTRKQYADGSGVSYAYENTTSRLRQRTDEKNQVTAYNYARDGKLVSIAYSNASSATPNVNFAYDPNYERISSMTDGSGTTRYAYNPIAVAPALGARELASIDGPLVNDTITFTYDELGRRITTAIAGVPASTSFDAAGRAASVTNALGAFGYTYDGASYRRTGKTYPNGQTTDYAYGTYAQDQLLQRLTHRRGATALSEFLYTRDVPKSLITVWSQQTATQTPTIHNFTYDSEEQILADSVTVGGAPTTSFAYTYDPAGNRLTEQIGAVTRQANYNALNELTNTQLVSGAAATYEWDGENRLSALVAGNNRTEFSYDGLSRRVGIRHLVNSVEVSHRRFVWCDTMICEERTTSGTVTKRYFDQGMKVETGPAAGTYFYTLDHLGSIRELTDNAGAIRARYSYDPFGKQTRVQGDLEADFGFAGMFWSPEIALNLTLFRAYDPAIGRWLSRDPLPNAELEEGPNLYAYVGNNPIGYKDSLGLCCEPEAKAVVDAYQLLQECQETVEKEHNGLVSHVYSFFECKRLYNRLQSAIIALSECRKKPCKPQMCPKK